MSTTAGLVNRRGAHGGDATGLAGDCRTWEASGRPGGGGGVVVVVVIVVVVVVMVAVAVVVVVSPQLRTVFVVVTVYRTKTIILLYRKRINHLVRFISRLEFQHPHPCRLAQSSVKKLEKKRK